VKENVQLKCMSIFGHVTKLWQWKKNKQMNRSQNNNTLANELTLWCAKMQYHTCNCVTHFGRTTGLPVPMQNPNQQAQWKRLILNF
jgi:hypothetical protein